MWIQSTSELQRIEQFDFGKIAFEALAVTCENRPASIGSLRTDHEIGQDRGSRSTIEAIGPKGDTCPKVISVGELFYYQAKLHKPIFKSGKAGRSGCSFSEDHWIDRR